tara:strand:- start:1532 stop:1705 length:174 start_codon:yes stop_codon:yes gene_type:complete
MSIENLNRSSDISHAKKINAGDLKQKVINRIKKQNLHNKIITIVIFLSIGLLGYFTG